MSDITWGAAFGKIKFEQQVLFKLITTNTNVSKAQTQEYKLEDMVQFVIMVHQNNSMLCHA